jgi:hypothetical protein
VRQQLRRTAVKAGVRRRFAPHQLRHAHAVEMAREGVPLNVIQRQLGHANLGITSVYLQGIDNAEIIDTVHGLGGACRQSRDRVGVLNASTTSRSSSMRVLRPEALCLPFFKESLRTLLR